MIQRLPPFLGVFSAKLRAVLWRGVERNADDSHECTVPENEDGPNASSTIFSVYIFGGLLYIWMVDG